MASDMVLGICEGVHPSSSESIDSELTEDNIAAIFQIAAACRSLSPNDVEELLKELEHNPEIATVEAYNDFPCVKITR